MEAPMSKSRFLVNTLAVCGMIAAAASAQAQDTKVAIGISGWTGFAPLTLAKEAGIFKSNALDVTVQQSPQKHRHLAIPPVHDQYAHTMAETWTVWNTHAV